MDNNFSKPIDLFHWLLITAGVIFGMGLATFLESISSKLNLIVFFVIVGIGGLLFYYGYKKNFKNDMPKDNI